MTARGLLPIAAALSGVAAIAVLGVAFVGRGAVTVSPPVLVGDIGVVTVNNSPAIVRNPQNPANVVVVSRVDRPGFSAAINVTTDGGRTWTTTTPPLPPELDRPFAPSAAFSPEGILYVTYVNLVGRGNRPESLWLATSNNGGRSFSEPVTITGEYPFQSQLVVDPTTGHLHVTWLQAEELGLLALPGTPVLVASHSQDGGQSWSDPVRVSDPSRERVGAAVPVVTGRGELVVVYKDFKDDRRDFENLEGPVWEEPFALVAARSSDGGRSFTDGVEFDADVVRLRRFLAFLPEFPGVATSGDDGVHVVWADGRNGDLDVFMRTSSDAGRSWTEPTRVNDNPLGDGTAQYLPAVDVADNGRVDVVYLDGRDDPTNVQLRASLAISAPGTSGFSTMLLSPTTFDSRIGPSAAGHLDPDFGSRLGVDSRDDGALAAWTDTTLGTATTGRQDVATRRVHIPTSLLPLSTAAVVAGVLLLAGAVMLVGHRRTRRSPPRADDGDAPTVPAGPSAGTRDEGAGARVPDGR